MTLNDNHSLKIFNLNKTSSILYSSRTAISFFAESLKQRSRAPRARLSSHAIRHTYTRAHTCVSSAALQPGIKINVCRPSNRKFLLEKSLIVPLARATERSYTLCNNTYAARRRLVKARDESCKRNVVAAE